MCKGGERAMPALFNALPHTKKRGGDMEDIYEVANLKL